jgi:8-oxo-dGTP pyrophosphatase MutT (NUDIX family)
VINDLATKLVQRLAHPLPGREAQFKMASSFRVPQDYVPDTINAKISGVLIALYFDNNTLRTILMKRPDYSGPHSGQVSFPGGKKELADKDIVATALREAQEEVALASEHVQVLGQLSELYVPASNFLVHPVIGVLSTTPILTADNREVAHILLPDVTQFFNTEKVGVKAIQINEGLTITAPFFDVEGHVVWGATAMILSELTQILSEVGFER